MNSFTKKLVLNCTGVIFISFLIVYFLFNLLVSNYIRSIAESELSDGVNAAVSMVSFIPPDMREMTITVAEAQPFTYRVETPAYVTVDQGQMSFRWHPGRLIGWYPYVVSGTSAAGFPLSPADVPPRVGQFEIITDMFVMPRDMDVLYWYISEAVPPSDENAFTLYSDVISRLAHGQVNISRMGRPALVDTNMIMINANNEIISPVLQTLNPQGRAQVEFLVGHYLDNQARLTTNHMTMVSGTSTAYYMRVVNQPMQDGLGPVSILLYTDISSAAAFQRSMNRILGALLVLSGVLSLAISIAMSAKFKRAINRLCNYADAIGRGNWEEKAGVFRDAEFNQLSKSMDSMSNKLQAYENNQKQFFQNVSHELRTPLMSIQGYAEGILSDVFGKDEAAGIILSEGHKMTDLVSELLYVSRIDNVQTPENIVVLDVQNLLYECVDRVKPIATKSDKTIALEVLENEISISADEEKLSRAILNILSNAIRHAKNEVKIVCGTADDEIKIVIRDDGDGINADDLPNIFDRFYKGENGNYGLGLAISNDIVKSMGGVITAKNLEFPEAGARFEVSLPVL